MSNDIRSRQAASFLNSQYDIQIQSVDIHRIVQINKEKTRSLSDAELFISESQRLLNTISQYNDHYHVKYKENSI